VLRAVWALAACLGTAAQPARAELLARFETQPAGWDGIRIGMSLVQLERRVGETLSVTPGSGTPVCSRFASRADYEGYRVVMGFASAKPGAKLESLWVDFDGEEASAGAADLEAALRRRLPAASELRDATPPAGSGRPAAVYLLPGEPPVVVRFVPREGLLIALRSCLP
jgi:hypothetical protein